MGHGVRARTGSSWDRGDLRGFTREAPSGAMRQTEIQHDYRQGHSTMFVGMATPRHHRHPPPISNIVPDANRNGNPFAFLEGFPADFQANNVLDVPVHKTPPPPTHSHMSHMPYRLNGLCTRGLWGDHESAVDSHRRWQRGGCRLFWGGAAIFIDGH